MELDQYQITTEETLKQIALLLPGSWQYEQWPHGHTSNQGRGYLVRADGLRIYARKEADKFTFSHSFPTPGKHLPAPTIYHPTTGDEIKSTLINTGANRDPDQLAKSIVNRLISSAEFAEKIARDKIEYEKQVDQKRTDAINLITDTLGVERREINDIRRADVHFSDDSGMFGGTVSMKVNGSGEINFDITRVEATKAVELISWIKNNLFNQ